MIGRAEVAKRLRQRIGAWFTDPATRSTPTHQFVVGEVIEGIGKVVEVDERERTVTVERARGTVTPAELAELGITWWDAY